MMGFTTETVIKQLKNKFICKSGVKDKIASFLTNNGRQIAVQTKNKTGVYIWFEKHNADISDIEVINQKNPGMPYSSGQARSSALNDTNASRLKVGNKAWYLKFTNQESLDNYLVWYTA